MGNSGQSDAELNAVLLGFGYWGPNILRNILSSPHFRIHAIVDPDPSARDRARAATPGASIVPGVDDLDWTSIDAAFVAAPPEHHESLALQAIAAGSHVWVEKPFCVSFEQAWTVAQAAKVAEVALWVDLPYLFHSGVTTLVQEAASGAFGDYLYLLSNRSNFGLYHQTIDVMRDLLVHDLAIAQALTSDAPRAVTSSVLHESGSGATMAVITTRWESGFVMHSIGNQLAAEKSRLLELRGTHGAVTFDDNSADAKLRFVFADAPASRGSGATNLNAQYALSHRVVPTLSHPEPLAASMEAFANRIFGDKEQSVWPDPVTISLRSHLWIEAADKSIQEQGREALVPQGVWNSL